MEQKYLKQNNLSYFKRQLQYPTLAQLVQSTRLIIERFLVQSQSVGPRTHSLFQQNSGFVTRRAQSGAECVLHFKKNKNKKIQKTSNNLLTNSKLYVIIQSRVKGKPRQTQDKQKSKSQKTKKPRCGYNTAASMADFQSAHEVSTTSTRSSL